MIPDFTRILVEQLDGDQAVKADIYGQRFPEGTVEWPAVRVSMLSATNAAEPATSWWEALCQVDVFAASDAEGWQLVDVVQESLFDIDGESSGYVVARVASAGVQYTNDQGFKPPVGRWIVSVIVTARDVTSGGI
jgi:hypothetical protein